LTVIVAVGAAGVLVFASVLVVLLVEPESSSLPLSTTNRPTAATTKTTNSTTLEVVDCI
jgi:hypothetical protein